MKATTLLIKCLSTAFAMLLSVMLLSCSTSDDEHISPSPDAAQLTVAVVAPLSDTAMKARLERTAQWMLDNLRKEQAGDTSSVSLKLEWHDELAEDMDALGRELSVRDDLAAVIGPFDNGLMARMAFCCSQTHKPLIAPTTTSDNVLRRYAVASAGETGLVN